MTSNQQLLAATAPPCYPFVDENKFQTFRQVGRLSRIVTSYSVTQCVHSAEDGPTPLRSVVTMQILSPAHSSLDLYTQKTTYSLHFKHLKDSRVLLKYFGPCLYGLENQCSEQK